MAKIKKEKTSKKEARPVVIETPAQRLSGIIKTCRNIMRKDKGMNGDGDRLPMLTWIMFLKFLDDNEQLQEVNAQLEGKKYKSAIAEPYRWRDWAKDKNLTGDDLLAFVNNEKIKLADGKERTGLFYYLRALQSETGAERKDVIATVFKGVTNRMINGYLLRDIVNKIDEIHFTSNEELNSLSHLYESILKEMRDASGDAGEFYTPRPVVKFMVEMLDPKIGETVLDPACGTAGFLVEAFEHLKKQAKTVEHKKVLQEKSIIGGEAKPLPYLLAQMNLLLHGLNYPNIDSGNSLRVPLRDIGDNERVDIVLANPPFGGEEERGILNNFPDDKQTGETALLFLQLIMRKLKRRKPNQQGGRASVIVPNSALLANGIAGRIIKQLLREFNVHTIVRLGDGVFAPYTDIPSNLIFFDSTKPTEKIWFYEISVPNDKKKYSKSKPIRTEEFDKIKKWWNLRIEGENAWSVSVKDVIAESENGAVSINLDSKNPNKKDIFKGLDASSIANEIYNQISENLGLIEEIQNKIKLSIDAPKLPLSEAIEENTEEVIVDPSQSYEFAGVYGFGKGMFRRQALEGSNTSYKVFNRLHENDLVISKVKGWEGAIALVTKEFEGLFLSPQYPSFKAKEGINIKYISEYCKHPKVWQDLLNKSKGIGARRNSISVPTFLSLEIPLPKLEIQDKIVDALEKLAQLKKHQKELNNKLEILTPAILENVFNFESAEKSSIPENKKGFAKQVLGGKIVSLFKDDENFTNIKFQKLQYLAEHIIEVDLNWNYYRQSAGPYDNKFMHTVFYKLQQNQWFESRNYKFYSLKKADDIERHFQNYFGNKEEKLNKLFGLLQNASEKFCEAVATIYAVWNNHIIQKLPFDKSKIKTDFFEWSGRKEIIFSEEEFEQALSWMAKHDITPVGFGYLIKEKK